MSGTIAKRTGLCILACLFTLVLAEAGLRLAGYLYLLRFRTAADVLIQGDAALPRPGAPSSGPRILCVGDSFTFGLGGGKGGSYPDQLQALVGPRTEIINEGIPGHNSSQLVDRLPALIDRYHPSAMVVMVGCNDVASLAASRYYMFVSPFALWRFRFAAHLADLRVWKLVRRGIQLLIRRAVVQQNVQAPLSTDPEFLRYLKEGDRLWARCMPSETLVVYQKAASLAPGDYRPHYAMGRLYMHQLQDNQKAHESFKQALQRSPGSIEIYDEMATLYYRMDQPHEADRCIRAAARPDKCFRQNYGYLLRYGTPSRSDKHLFDRLIEYNLERILRIATERRVTVTFMGYPMREHRPTEIISRFARRTGSIIVDNAPAFDRVLQTPGAVQSDFFVEDGHCNRRGYGIIAGNVCAALEQNGLLEPAK